MSGLRERWAVRRFERRAGQRYAHAVARHRKWPCRRACLRCAWHFATGGHRRELRLTLMRSRAFAASSSWWPLSEPRVLPSGRSYRTRVRPYEYADYQQWKKERGL